MISLGFIPPKKSRVFFKKHSFLNFEFVVFDEKNTLFLNLITPDNNTKVRLCNKNIDSISYEEISNAMNSCASQIESQLYKLANT